MDGFAVAWSGFVATTLAITFFGIARWLRLTTFSPTVQLGCVWIEDPRHPLADTVGILILFAFGSTVGPAVLRMALTGWNGPAWVGGTVAGGVLGLLVAAGLPVLGTVSACVRSGRIPPPGPFGIQWGRPTPGIIFAGAMLYGAVAAAIMAGF